MAEVNEQTVKITPCRVLLERFAPGTPEEQLALSHELKKVIAERNLLTSKTKTKFIKALDDINAENNESSTENSHKTKVCQEILDTECTYLKQLETIMNYFMKPIKDQRLITLSEFDTLFGHIGIIYQVNGELLNELRQDVLQVTNAFSKITPFFKLYSAYAYDYKKSLEMLDHLLRNNKAFSKLVHDQETRPEVQTKLSSLLIVPIQRVPRYCLLVKQVLQVTKKTDSNYISLRETYNNLQDVARHINALVDESENAQHSLELLRLLKNGKSLIIKPGRKVIKDGVLKILTNGDQREVYVILFDDQLMVCKIKKPKLQEEESLKCKYILPLKKCSITLNDLAIIEVKCLDTTLELFHDENRETTNWAAALESAVVDYLRKRSTLRKGSSARRPALSCNFEEFKDLGVSPGISGYRKRRHNDRIDLTSDPPKVLKLDDKNDRILSKVQRSLCLKRRSIHNNEHATSSTRDQKLIENKKDSLYPLRTAMNFNKVETNDDEPMKHVVAQNEEVYVFGQSRSEDRGFKFRGLFTGIANSVKKVFGWS